MSTELYGIIQCLTLSEKCIHESMLIRSIITLKMIYNCCIMTGRTALGQIYTVHICMFHQQSSQMPNFLYSICEGRSFDECIRIICVKKSWHIHFKVNLYVDIKQKCPSYDGTHFCSIHTSILKCRHLVLSNIVWLVYWCELTIAKDGVRISCK